MSWTSGATTPWSAGVAVIDLPATTSLGMWFVLPPMTGPILRRSWKSQGSLSLGTLLTTTALLIQTCLTPPFPLADRADVWVPRGSSGGQEAWAPSLVPCALALPCLIPRLLQVSSLRWSPAKTRSSAQPLSMPRRTITFCPLVLEAVGGGWSDHLGWWARGSGAKANGGSQAALMLASRLRSASLDPSGKTRSAWKGVLLSFLGG